MKRLIYLSALVMMVLTINTALSQDAIKLYEERSQKNEPVIRNPLDKKFRWGVTFQHYWVGIKGSDLPKEYFFKPSLGGAVRVEYYIKPFIGVAAGFGYIQGGAGIINEDKTGGAFTHPWEVGPSGLRGDMDSTHLQKIRLNAIEFPVSLIFKTPKGKGDFRLSGGVGAVFVKNLDQNEAWLDIVGGMHDYHFVDTYSKSDVALQFALGTDINAGEQNVFQVQLLLQRGLKNIYSAGQGTGHQVVFGARLAYLF